MKWHCEISNLENSLNFDINIEWDKGKGMYMVGKRKEKVFSCHHKTSSILYKMIFPLQRDIIFVFPLLFRSSLCACRVNVFFFVQRIEDTLISYAVAYLKALGIEGFILFGEEGY